MRKLLASATLLLCGMGLATNANAQLQLKGSDTLEDITRDVILACPGVPVSPNAGFITYVGGGSGAGESAMPSTQNIAPMSRQLGAAICTANPTWKQLLIGLDGLAVVGADQLLAGGDSTERTVPVADDCQDAIQAPGTQTCVAGLCSVSGATCVTADDCNKIRVLCTADPALPNSAGATADQAAECVATGSYTFGGTAAFPSTVPVWKDVLRMVYSGQNHDGPVTALIANPKIPAGCPVEGDVNNPCGSRIRNPRFFNIRSAVRANLVNQWSKLFANVGGAGPVCRSQKCAELKHAFRRGDLSGTTDTFISLVGINIAVPAFSNKSFTNGIGKSAGATQSPFANGGDGVGNKGDTDYLDLDPIRRIADSGPSPARVGFEQVAEAWRAASNPPVAGTCVAGFCSNFVAPYPLRACVVNADCAGGDHRTGPGVTVAELIDFGGGVRQNLGPDPANAAGWLALQQAAVRNRFGLGLVLPIEIPTNYSDLNTAYWAATPGVDGPPVLCTPGKFAPTIPDAAFNGGIVANGTAVGIVLPVRTVSATDDTVVTYNCLSNSPAPARLPAVDERAYNTLVVDSVGHHVKDNYFNTTVLSPALNATRQRRTVSAWYRLHTNQVTSFGDTATAIFNHGVSSNLARVTGGYCQNLTSTDQIGCLVRASPCSVGFAGREAVNEAEGSMAFRLGPDLANSVPPSLTRIQELTDTVTTSSYPLARKLWVNHVAPPVLDLPNGATGALLGCFSNGAIVNPILTNRGFVPLASGLPVDGIACGSL